MNLMQSEIVRSAQVWVCDSCGCKDTKSCGCDSTAHQEELAAKREAHRQANRRSYEKAKQNQQSSDNPRNIEDIDDFQDEPVFQRESREASPTPVREIDRGAFLVKSNEAFLMAAYEGQVDEVVARSARKAANAWTALADKLEEAL